MTNETKPAEWAVKRACQLTEELFYDEQRGTGFEIDPDKADYPSVRAFARYIEAHEEPPVDPFKMAVKAAYDATTASAFGYDKFIDDLSANLSARGLCLRLANSDDRATEGRGK